MMMRRVGRGLAVIGLLAAMPACVGRAAPPGGMATVPSPGKPPGYPPPGDATPARVAPVRQPIPATPLAPVANSLFQPGAGTASKAGLVAGPPIGSLGIGRGRAAAALAAFRISCPALTRRADASGLTRPADWRPACAAAAGADDPPAFFARWFETVQVGEGRAYATGYYVPELPAARTRRKGFEVPIYGRPGDLIDVDLGQFSPALKGKSVRGRVDGRKLVPYYDRTAIEEGAIAGTAPVIAWAADPVAVFFLQVQGSGRLRLVDGGEMGVGYETQNGYPYVGIGGLLRDRGILKGGQLSMQGIVAWLRAHPEEGRDVMRENRSFVFFRRLDGPAEGALGLPVTGGVSAAADPSFVPLGAPVFLSLDRTDATGLWVAQDTGGAIKGANRFDTFWGQGGAAEAVAGGMSGRGTAFLLLPRGTLARLGVAGGGTTP